MWIDYRLGSEVSGTVPVRRSDLWFFEDGAYDAYDHLVTDDDSSKMQEWERVVCDIIAPKLSEAGHGHAVSFNIDGRSWTFARNNLRDENGR